MELYLMNRDFSPLDALPFGAEDLCTSVVWEERYFEPGRFTLHTPRKNGRALREAVYIADGFRCGRVEGCSITADGDCEVRGHLLESLLADRRIYGKGILTGALSSVTEQVVRDNSRGLPLAFETGALLPEVVSLPYAWENLADFLYERLRPHGASFRVRLDRSRRQPVFSLLCGANRSTVPEAGGRHAAEKKAAAIFSASFGNIAGLELETDTADFRNVVYIEGGDGTVVEIDHSSGGLRRELYRKAADLRPDAFENPAEYPAALRRRGEELLVQYPRGFSVTAEIDGQALPRYGVDYALGDICDVVDETLGVCYALRLTAVDTVCENGSCLIFPSFGEKVHRMRRLLAEKE